MSFLEFVFLLYSIHNSFNSDKCKGEDSNEIRDSPSREVFWKVIVSLLLKLSAAVLVKKIESKAPAYTKRWNKG